jgi:hypothetical protein
MSRLIFSFALAARLAARADRAYARDPRPRTSCESDAGSSHGERRDSGSRPPAASRTVVARVEVSEALVGAKGLTQLKIRFPAGQPWRRLAFTDLKPGSPDASSCRAGRRRRSSATTPTLCVDPHRGPTRGAAQGRHAAAVIAEPIKLFPPIQGGSCPQLGIVVTAMQNRLRRRGESHRGSGRRVKAIVARGPRTAVGGPGGDPGA